MKTKAFTNQKELLQELKKLQEACIGVEKGAKRDALLKGIKKTMQRCIEAEKLYQKLRPKMTEEERKEFDNLSGWFEHQDN